MKSLSDCLTDEQLANVVNGSSSFSDDSVAEHLESCLKCRNALGRIGDDESVAKLKSGLASSVELKSPELSAVISRLKEMSSAEISSTSLKGTVSKPVDLSQWLTPMDSGLGLLGGYKLLRLLGQGGMGAVYLANEQSLDRLVAIKVLLPEFAKLESARERFLNEARASAALKHPNVVSIHRVESEKGFPFLVLEYVDGATLDQSLSDLNGSQRLNVGKEITAAVAAAHQLGIIHRDIKPSNILIEAATKTAKLTDFGLAKTEAPNQVTQTGIVVGTPGFIAPEVLSGESRPSKLSDIYSLGVTLRRIFPAADANPKWVESVIESATQHNPSRRPQSAEEITIALAFGPATSISKAFSRRGLLVSTVLIGALMVLWAWQPWRSKPRLIVVRNSIELATALQNAPDGSTIRIDSYEPFELQETNLDRRSLSIESFKKRQAIIRFAPVTSDNLDPMIRTNGDLVLSNLRLVYKDGGEDPDSIRCLIQLDKGNLKATSCSFVLGPSGTIINASQSARIELDDCRLHTLDGVAINCQPAPSTQLILNRCVFSGASVVDVPVKNSVEIQMSRCTVFADYFLDVSTNEWAEETSPPLSLDVRLCIFSTSSGVLGFDWAELATEDFKTAIAWTGQNNVFNGSLVALHTEFDERYPTWANFGEPWQLIAQENGSQTSEKPFLVSNSELETAHNSKIELSDDSLRPFAYGVGAID